MKKYITLHCKTKLEKSNYSVHLRSEEHWVALEIALKWLKYEEK